MIKTATEKKYPIFSDRLRLLRKSNKMTQERVAMLLNVERSTYAKYETGQSMPHQGTLLRLADLFCVSVDYLLGKTPSGGTVCELRDDGTAPGLSAEDTAMLAVAHKLTKEQRESWMDIAYTLASANAELEAYKTKK